MKKLLLLVLLFGVWLNADAQNMVQYEYWYDSNYGSTTVVTTSPDTILDLNSSLTGTSGLTPGLHTMNFRAQDSNGKWSSAITEQFYNTGNWNVESYEYWFDEEYASKITTTIAPSQTYILTSDFNTTSAGYGLHALNFRIKDNAGKWSSTIREYFFKSIGGSQLSTAEYWIDSDFANRQPMAFTSSNSVFINQSILTSNLDDQLHTFNFRMQDQGGKWSVVTSTYFMAQSQIVGYEYWFDTDFANKVSTNITPTNLLENLPEFNSRNLPVGDHVVYFRAKNNSGKYSTTIAQTFSVIITAPPIVSDQELLGSPTVADLVATGTDLKWYISESSETALASNTPLSTGTYYVSQTIDSRESIRVPVVVTVTFVIPTSLTFCKGAKVSDAIGTSTMKFYTTITKGTLLVATTNLSSRTLFATQTVNGIESSPRVPVVITVNPLPLTLATLTTSDAVLCKYIGTENTVTYTAAAGASSYIWSVPGGVSIKSGQGTNALVVDFSTSTASGIFSIGRVGVKAVDTNGCISAAAKSIALSTKFPIAPKTLVLTNPTILEGAPIKKIGPYLETSTVFTLTAEIAPTAHHYRWLLPSGVNQVGGSSTSNVITVNFSGVSGIGDLPISVYSVGGCGESIARTLILKRVEPKAPSALVLTTIESNLVTLPVDILDQIKKVGPYVGKSTILTLVATPITIQGSTATSYQWEFPAGVTSYGTTTTTVGDVTTISSTSNIITVDFAGVGATILSLPITVYAVNGAGKSVPRILNLTSAAPSTPGVITTPVTSIPTFNPICNSTITVQVPSVFGVTYTWTVGSGATILSGNGTNSIEIDVTSVTANSILVSVIGSNGTGQSATRSLTIKKSVTCRESASNGLAQEFSVIAYPNPSSAVFTIEVDSNKGKSFEVKVYDMTGKLVEIRQEKSNLVEVGSNYPSGIYNVLVTQDANTKNLRVIKK